MRAVATLDCCSRKGSSWRGREGGSPLLTEAAQTSGIVKRCCFHSESKLIRYYSEFWGVAASCRTHGIYMGRGMFAYALTQTGGVSAICGQDYRNRKQSTPLHTNHPWQPFISAGGRPLISMCPLYSKAFVWTTTAKACR